MNLTAEANQALRTAYTELFWLAERLRKGDVPAARTSDVRTYAEGLLRQERRTLLRADVDDQVVSDAEMAVIALLDEAAQHSPVRECAEQWMARLLQYEHYHHSNLGRDFFDKLDVLRQRPDTPLPLLEIYARCLTWGFAGRYREENRLHDLGVLRDALRVELGHRMSNPPLCPPLQDRTPLPPAAPLFAASWVLGLGASLLLLVGVILTACLYFRASATTSALQKLGSASELERSRTDSAEKGE